MEDINGSNDTWCNGDENLNNSQTLNDRFSALEAEDVLMPLLFCY